MQSHYRRTRARLGALAETHGNDGPIHPQVTAVAVDRVAVDDAVFLADVGTPTLWAARYLRLNPASAVNSGSGTHRGRRCRSRGYA